MELTVKVLLQTVPCVQQDSGVPKRAQTLFHVRQRHMHQVGVLFALSVQLDHIALQLNYPLMFLAVMEHMQIQKDRIHVANVQKDSSA